MCSDCIGILTRLIKNIFGISKRLELHQNVQNLPFASRNELSISLLPRKLIYGLKNEIFPLFVFRFLHQDQTSKVNRQMAKTKFFKFGTPGKYYSRAISYPEQLATLFDFTVGRVTTFVSAIKIIIKRAKGLGSSLESVIMKKTHKLG